MLSSTMPVGIGGGKEEAGNIELARHGDGVSGVVGEVIYDCVGFESMGKGGISSVAMLGRAK